MSDLLSVSRLSNSLVPYYMTMQHLELMQEILIGQKPIRYNRNKNILYIDTDWDQFSVGEYLIIETYQVVDPDTFEDVWKDRWLKEYATNLIKRQWCDNMTKFNGMLLPGGISFNGATKLLEAETRIRQLEDEMINSYSLPAGIFIG